MSSKGSLMQTKKQVLQKDLSFSNQIFTRTLHSKNTSHQSIHNHNLTTNSNNNNHTNTIPPLVNYYQPPPPLVQHHILSSTPQKSLQQQSPKQKQQNQKMNIFERKFKPNFNTLKQQSPAYHTGNPQYYSSIPPLSELQNNIAKKYQKHQQPNQPYQSNSNKPTTVYFDNSQQPHDSHFHNNTQQILNIESLEQSTIANDSIQKQNNWIINNMQQNSGFFEDNTILGNLSKKSLNRKNVNKSLMNNSFKNINPLQLLNNSLHTSHQPMFVEDDQLSEDNNNLQVQKGKASLNNGNNNEMNLKSIHDRLKIFNTVNNKQQAVNTSKQQQHSRLNYNKLTLDLYQQYVQPFSFINSSNYNNKQQHADNNGDLLQTISIHDSILINDLDYDVKNKGFDILTTKSTPINQYYTHQQDMHSRLYTQHKTVSYVDENHSIQEEEQHGEYDEDNHYQQLNAQRGRQHFVRDNSAETIISAILSDQNKMKLYLKYLQLRIAKQSQTSSNVCQNYELLSCLLLKINEITEKGQKQPNSSATRSLAQQIENVSRVKSSSPSKQLINQYNSLNYQAQQQQQQTNIRPQIIRSSLKGIRINFDPYLNYQSEQISKQISYLKKCLQEKTKEQELIKINYDAIIHNYANSLEKLVKTSNSPQQQGYHNSSIDRQSNCNNDQNEPLQTQRRKSQDESEKLSQKMYLDLVNNSNNRNNEVLSMSSSLDDNHRYRKATFGKVGSFRESGNNHDTHYY